MRIVFLTLGLHPDLIGGAYRFIAEVSARLAKDHDIDLICPKPVGGLADEEVRANVRIHRFDNAKGFFYHNWRKENRQAAERLDQLLGKGGGMLALCHAYFAPAGRPHGPRSVFLFTGPWAEEYLCSRRKPNFFHRIVAGAMRRTEREALRKVRGILVISNYYRESLPRWHGQGLAPVHLCPGGVDAGRFAPVPDREAVRQRLGVPGKEFVFLTVRRLDPRMGLLLLLESFAEAAAGSPCRLWIAGEGPQELELRARQAELGLGQQVKFLGKIPEDELPRFWSAADCGVMPSLDLEGFGLATLEGLACGTPVLGSRCGATPELLEALEPALLFEPRSKSALSRTLAEVMKGGLRLPDRQKCRTYVESRFSWDEPVRRLEGLLEEVSRKRKGEGGCPSTPWIQ